MCFNDCAQIFKIHENFESMRRYFLGYFLEEEEERQMIKLRNFNVGGKIILSHCRGHDTIIIFFQIDGFVEEHIRFLSKNFGFR